MTGPERAFERSPSPSRRRVRNGIRLKADPEALTGWLARAWVELVRQRTGAEELAAGLEYARGGQATRLDLGPGFVAALVQGHAARPYRTRWLVPVLDEAQWRQVIDAMAAEALYAAKLLARELPQAVEQLLEPLGLGLAPRAGEVQAECSCGRGPGCRHAAALGLLAAERLQHDPLEGFALRGMAGAEVLERLGVTRAQRLRGAAAAHAEPIAPPLPAAPPPEFWRPGAALAELQRLPPAHHASHALLRRLGPSPLAGRFPMVGLLASVYDTVARHAIELRDRAERLDGEDGPA